MGILVVASAPALSWVAEAVSAATRSLRSTKISSRVALPSSVIAPTPDSLACSMPATRRARQAAPFLQRAGLLAGPLDDAKLRRLTPIVEAVGDRLKTLETIVDHAACFYTDDFTCDPEGVAKRLKGLGEQMVKTPDEQISLTDPDARSMATSARGSGVVGYNVQTVVDTKHHLVVTHEVTNKGTDRAQLSTMGQQAQEALGTEKITALADRGYYAGPEILACEQAGINALVPKTYTSNNVAKGQFDKRDFHYIAEKNEYRCPAGGVRSGASRRSRMAR